MFAFLAHFWYEIGNNFDDVIRALVSSEQFFVMIFPNQVQQFNMELLTNYEAYQKHIYIHTCSNSKSFQFGQKNTHSLTHHYVEAI